MNYLLKLKRFLAFAHDVLASCLVWILSYFLRFNFEIPQIYLNSMLDTLPWIIAIQGVFFLIFGLYRGLWRFASLVDLRRIIFSVLSSIFIITALMFMLRFTFVVPRSVLVMDPLLLILVMGGSRFIYRAVQEYEVYGIKVGVGEPVILIGSGVAGVTLARELAMGDRWRVLGILDNDKSIQGREVSGVKILGQVESLPKLKDKFGINKVIIAGSDLTQFERREIIQIASKLELEVLTVPLMDDLISGKLSISNVRPFQVEDLLGRDQVDLDATGLDNLIRGKVILVSGAGGSIGSELCRQISRFHPAALICLDISEYALYQLEQDLTCAGRVSSFYIVADVRNEKRLTEIFRQFKPAIIFHAAAYKHVPMMENFNVAEAFFNNIMGTYILAKVAKKLDVEKFVLVSTDKAVNPTNVMGATKRLAEMVCQGMQGRVGTDFVIVRFGNVLGSSGSVIPKFRQQITDGGPITVTHPEITRYFMSIPEAAQLVMQACLMGKKGEIFVLDMGDPVKIVDLAKDMIRLSGLDENEISIEFTGLRPGEKLFEELLANDETTLPTRHPKLRIASARIVSSNWMKGMLAWVKTIVHKDEVIIKKELKSWVEEYEAANND